MASMMRNLEAQGSSVRAKAPSSSCSCHFLGLFIHNSSFKIILIPHTLLFNRTKGQAHNQTSEWDLLRLLHCLGASSKLSEPPSGKLYFTKVTAPTLVFRTLSLLHQEGKPESPRLETWHPHSHTVTKEQNVTSYTAAPFKVADANDLSPPLSPSPSLSFLSPSPLLTPTPKIQPPCSQKTVLSIHQYQLLNSLVDKPSDDHRLCFQGFH